RDFVGDARLALAQTGNALHATANPIELVRAPDRGRTWALSAQVQAYALALTISFLTLVLAAGSLAAERDENVVGRLARGLVGLRRRASGRAPGGLSRTRPEGDRPRGRRRERRAAVRTRGSLFLLVALRRAPVGRGGPRSRVACGPRPRIRRRRAPRRAPPAR